MLEKATRSSLVFWTTSFLIQWKSIASSDPTEQRKRILKNLGLPKFVSIQLHACNLRIYLECMLFRFYLQRIDFANPSESFRYIFYIYFLFGFYASIVLFISTECLFCIPTSNRSSRFSIADFYSAILLFRRIFYSLILSTPTIS